MPFAFIQSKYGIAPWRIESEQICVLLGLLISLSLLWPLQAQAGEQTWTINVQDTEIKTVVEQIAEITEEDYVLDSNVQGKITVVSKKPLTRSGINDLLVGVLKTRGYTVVNSGDVKVVMPQNVARESSSPVVRPSAIKGADVITVVLPLKYIGAQELVNVLRAMVAGYGYLEAAVSSNALVVTDHADNVARIKEVVRELDTPESSELEIVPLQYAWVGNVLNLLERLAYSRGKTEDAVSRNQYVRIVGNERSNSIVLKGSAEERSRIKKLIAELDQPEEDEGSGIQGVSRLLHTW